MAIEIADFPIKHGDVPLKMVIFPLKIVIVPLNIVIFPLKIVSFPIKNVFPLNMVDLSIVMVNYQRLPSDQSIPSWGFVNLIPPKKRVAVTCAIAIYRMTDLRCWYENANILGVYWWDTWHTIYSSTMDPSWV